MQPTQKNSYDEVPYESLPVQGSHPDRLFTLARLPGVEAPALATCRVLELGCAGGGNLIPMALERPGAQFTGVDLSAVQVADAAALIQALQLDNVKVMAMSVTDIDESFGQFDYIIAHGLYSWVPSQVQEKILQICKRNLSPQGVAYVSYNTLPGWRTRGMIRDLMRYHAMKFPEPLQRVQEARTVLEFLGKGVPQENNPYGDLMRSEVDLLRGAPDYYILHEHLDELNEPIYFHEFIDRAQRHGLQYLADADITSMMGSRFPPQVGDMVRRIATDAIRQEQLMDFLTNRTFRQTLLVHAEQPIDRKITVERLQGLWVSSTAQPQSAKPNLAEGAFENFCTPAGMCVNTAKAITKSALITLAACGPSAMQINDLMSSAFGRLNPFGAKQPGPQDFETLAGDLMHGNAMGIVQLHAGASPFSVELGVRPQASRLARHQARNGPRITTLQHESIVVPEAIRALIPLLDGSRTVAEIAAAIKAQGTAALSRFADRDALQTAVKDIARLALIVD